MFRFRLLTIASALLIAFSLSATAQEISEDEVLDLPQIDLLERDLGKEAYPRGTDRFSFTEEASGEINLLTEEEEPRSTSAGGPRFLPQPLERGIGSGLRGIDHLTSPITRAREFSGPGDKVIEFNPAKEKAVKIEF